MKSLAFACVLCVPALALGIEATLQTTARVALESGAESGRNNWVDFHVDGENEAAAARCARLVDAELRRVFPAGAMIHPRVVRACGPGPLPVFGPPAIDAQMLRAEDALPSLDLFALSAPPTTGRIVRFTRTLSAAQCEAQREHLSALAGAAPEHEDALHFLEEEQRRNAEKTSILCRSSSGLDEGHKGKRRRTQSSAWLERDTARSHCEQAKAMGAVLARRRTEHPRVEQVLRSCVRE